MSPTVKSVRLLFAVLGVTMGLAVPAAAQSLSLDIGDGGSATGRIIQILALLTVLSLAPSILIMVTSFTRIVVVLSFLRSALGLQQTPPNAVLISLALFLTGFIITFLIYLFIRYNVDSIILGAVIGAVGGAALVAAAMYLDRRFPDDRATAAPTDTTGT